MGLSTNAHYKDLKISISEVLWFTFWPELEILSNNDKNWEEFKISQKYYNIHDNTKANKVFIAMLIRHIIIILN